MVGKIKSRVALVGEYGVGYSPQVLQGVIDFVEHASHWQLQGEHHGVFVKSQDVKPGVFDGLIGYFESPEDFQVLHDAHVLAVNLANFCQSDTLPRVAHDDLLIGQMAAEYLLELGFINFGFFAWPHELRSRQQYTRFCEVIEKNAKFTCHDLYCTDKNSHQRKTLIAKWIDRLPKPIAIFVSGNYLAMVLAERIAAAGLSVPDDIALLGVGTERWSIPIAPYRLSCVETDDRRQGYLAAQTLDRLLDGDSPPPVQCIPPTGVASRVSTNVMMSEDPLVRMALAYIRDHAHEGISVEDVLGAVGVSRSTLTNRMKRGTGKTVHQVICQTRVEQTKQLLLHSDQTIEQIALACGFKAQPRLNEVFHRLTGMTPSDYRRQSGAVERTSLI